MSPPLWKTLVDKLKSEGFESPYLDRLAAAGARFDRAAPRLSLEREIVAEMAEALGRSEQKVNLALLELELSARELDRATTDEERRSRAAEYNRRREHARRMRWELQVHRDALGFHRHEDLDLYYPIPPAR